MKCEQLLANSAPIMAKRGHSFVGPVFSLPIAIEPNPDIMLHLPRKQKFEIAKLRKSKKSAILSMILLTTFCVTYYLYL